MEKMKPPTKKNGLWKLPRCWKSVEKRTACFPTASHSAWKTRQKARPVFHSSHSPYGKLKNEIEEKKNRSFTQNA
jgi:hypothetical protein